MVDRGHGSNAFSGLITALGKLNRSGMEPSASIEQGGVEMLIRGRLRALGCDIIGRCLLPRVRDRSETRTLHEELRCMRVVCLSDAFVR